MALFALISCSQNVSQSTPDFAMYQSSQAYKDWHKFSALTGIVEKNGILDVCISNVGISGIVLLFQM